MLELFQSIHPSKANVARREEKNLLNMHFFLVLLRLSLNIAPPCYSNFVSLSVRSLCR